jgi:single-strand DNA-binding protein
MPEVNTVLIAGNLTKDPIIRKTTSGIPVINFCLASNRKYRDASNHWAEDVCYVGVVAWSRLAESCMEKLKKGSAVLVDGELQSRTWHTEEGTTRTVVEIKAHRIQFLNKQELPFESHGHVPEELLFEDEYEVLEAPYAVGAESGENGEGVLPTIGVLPELKLKTRGECDNGC